jgi:COP9 signalosome complex subunit 3
MDAVTAVLGAFSPTQAAAESVKKYDSVIKDHVAAVKSLLTNQRQVINENTSQILQVIDPSIDSIAFLAILHNALSSPTSPPGIDRPNLLDQTLRFLLKFDPFQIRYVGLVFRKLLEHVAEGNLFPVCTALRQVMYAFS